MTATPGTAQKRPVFIPLDQDAIAGDLEIPAGVHGIVLFAHGSESSRHSPHDRFVACELQEVRRWLKTRHTSLHPIPTAR